MAAFFDNENPQLDYGRADYDQTHIIDLNRVYDLPRGKGCRFININPELDLLIGSFQLGGILSVNTGGSVTIADPPRHHIVHYLNLSPHL